MNMTIIGVLLTFFLSFPGSFIGGQDNYTKDIIGMWHNGGQIWEDDYYTVFEENGYVFHQGYRNRDAGKYKMLSKNTIVAYFTGGNYIREEEVNNGWEEEMRPDERAKKYGDEYSSDTSPYISIYTYDPENKTLGRTNLFTRKEQIDKGTGLTLFKDNDQEDKILCKVKEPVVTKGLLGHWFNGNLHYPYYTYFMDGGQVVHYGGRNVERGHYEILDGYTIKVTLDECSFDVPVQGRTPVDGVTCIYKFDKDKEYLTVTYLTPDRAAPDEIEDGFYLECDRIIPDGRYWSDKYYKAGFPVR